MKSFTKISVQPNRKLYLRSMFFKFTKVWPQGLNSNIVCIQSMYNTFYMVKSVISICTGVLEYIFYEDIQRIFDMTPQHFLIIAGPQVSDKFFIFLWYPLCQLVFCFVLFWRWFSKYNTIISVYTYNMGIKRFNCNTSTMLNTWDLTKLYNPQDISSLTGSWCMFVFVAFSCS